MITCIQVENVIAITIPNAPSGYVRRARYISNPSRINTTNLRSISPAKWGFCPF